MPRRSWIARLGALIALFVFVTSCGGGGITVEDRVTGLRFVIQPVDVEAGQVFSVTVELLDQDNQRADFADNEVRMNVSGGAALGGDVEVDASSGLAVFNNLTIPMAGPELRLIASTGSHSVQSSTFTVLGACDMLAGTIVVGGNSAGALQSGDCEIGTIFPVNPLFDGYVDRWGITLNGASNLRIALSSNAFDAYLYVLDSDGNILAENDDRDGTNAQISQNFAAGDYLILANSLLAGETGPYSLEVDEVGACEVAVGVVDLNTTRSGMLGAGDCDFGNGRFVDYYYMQSRAPSVFTVSLASNAFTPFLGATTVGADHQLAGQIDPGMVTIEFATPRGDLWYFIGSEMAVPGNNPVGAYDLTVSPALQRPQEGCFEFPTNLVENSAPTARITAADCDTGGPTNRDFDIYSVYLLQGETISATLSAGFVAHLQIQRGVQVIDDLQNIPAGTSGTIEWTAPAEDFYSVFVLPQNAGVTGDYGITISDISNGAPVAVRPDGGRVAPVPYPTEAAPPLELNP